jgi:hypothetical protein
MLGDKSMVLVNVDDSESALVHKIEVFRRFMELLLLCWIVDILIQCISGYKGLKLCVEDKNVS